MNKENNQIGLQRLLLRVKWTTVSIVNALTSLHEKKTQRKIVAIEIMLSRSVFTPRLVYLTSPVQFIVGFVGVQTSGKMACHNFKSNCPQRMSAGDKGFPLLLFSTSFREKDEKFSLLWFLGFWVIKGEDKSLPPPLFYVFWWEAFYHSGRNFLTHPTHDYWQFTKIGFHNSKIVEFPLRNG